MGGDMTQPKFLIVEDDHHSRELLCTMLDSLGCKTTAFETAEEALEYVDTLENAMELDAIFLDIILPGMNGFEAITQLKERLYTQSIPIIVLTSQGEKNDMIKGYEKGAEYYIPKPFTLQQLTFGLDMILGDKEN